MAGLPEKLLSERVSQYIKNNAISYDYDRDNWESSQEIQLIREMMLRDSVCPLAFEARALAGYFMMQPFSHSSSAIEAEVRADIANMKGAWISTLMSMLSYIPYGNSFTEFACEIKDRAYLARLRTLDHRYYYYEGSRNRVDRVVYDPGDGGQEVKIPYGDGIHLVNQPSLCLGNPNGVRTGSRALPWYELEGIVNSAMAIATQRQATPLLIGKTDTSAMVQRIDAIGRAVVDGNGNPEMVYSRDLMLEMLESMGNSSVGVIDRADDVIVAHQEVNVDFFTSLLYECGRKRLESFLVPPTLVSFSASGLGDSNLSQTHLSMFNRMVGAQMMELGEAIVEQMLKRVIIFNHGEQTTYGHFPVDVQNPLALELLGALCNAVSVGVFSVDDIAVIEKARHLAGL